ncbi:MAG: ABC transporter ATP-binding protein, partial [Clostridia bacterium]|nr:ABC transporter ATP-binding protein [Clostridia bacterium]
MQRMGGHMSRGFMTEEEKANRPKVTGALLKRVFSYLKPYWKQFVLILCAIAASSLLALYPSVLTGRIVDALAERKGVALLVKLILLSLGVTLGSNLIGVGQNYLNSWIAQHITFDMRNKMYAHLQQMSQRFFTTNNQGDIITRMTSDISGVQSVITNTFTSILSNSITLIAALAVMYQRNWMLATLGVLVIPLFVIPSRHAGKTRWTLTRESQACNDEVNGILNETLSVSGQMLVKLFGKEKYEYERYKSVNQRMIRLNIKESMAGRWFFMVISTFSSIGPMLLYLVGGILMMQYGQEITVGDITVMVALLGRMYGPVNQLL